MLIKNLKPVGLAYFGFGAVAIFLSLIGKITLVPIISGLMVFLVFFIVNAMVSFFKSSELNLGDFVILWGIPMLISFQALFLISETYKSFALIIITLLIVGILFISYKFNMKKGIPFFILLFSLIVGAFSSNF